MIGIEIENGSANVRGIGIEMRGNGMVIAIASGIEIMNRDIIVGE